MPQNNINIRTSTIRLTINNDQDKIIEFNPEDLSFIESLYDLISDFEVKEKEFKNCDRALNANKDIDKHGISKNTKARIKLNRDLCLYMRSKIDSLFGEGASDVAFGKSNTADMFSQFFEGITPFIETARQKKVDKYTVKAGSSGVMG